MGHITWPFRPDYTRWPDWDGVGLVGGQTGVGDSTQQDLAGDQCAASRCVIHSQIGTAGSVGLDWGGMGLDPWVNSPNPNHSSTLQSQKVGGC